MTRRSCRIASAVPDVPRNGRTCVHDRVRYRRPETGGLRGGPVGPVRARERSLEVARSPRKAGPRSRRDGRARRIGPGRRTSARSSSTRRRLHPVLDRGLSRGGRSISIGRLDRRPHRLSGARQAIVLRRRQPLARRRRSACVAEVERRVRLVRIWPVPSPKGMGTRRSRPARPILAA